MSIDVLGIDIAKNTFQLHGVDRVGKVVLKKRLARAKLSAYIANLPICTIVMEACGGANYWARTFMQLGHSVKLISPQFVKPFAKTNKNDANDAQAIVDAASRPTMNFVPIKQVEQQDIQSIHRVRTGTVKNRTALINEIRGLCLEYGVVLAPGAATVKSALISAIADGTNELTPMSRESMQDLYDELLHIEVRLRRLNTTIRQWCRNNEKCQRLLNVPGVGELTAAAVLAAVPNSKEFRNGRYVRLAWAGSAAIFQWRQASTARDQ